MQFNSEFVISYGLLIFLFFHFCEYLKCLFEQFFGNFPVWKFNKSINNQIFNLYIEQISFA